MPDNPFVARNKAVYRQILRAYKVANANQLAKKVEPLGIGRTTVYDWRDGESEPSEASLNIISKDTGKSSYWLLGLSEEEVNTEDVKDEGVNEFLIEQLQAIKRKRTKREKKKAG